MNNQIITEVKEIWKVVPNYPNYYVSNTGKVKSIYKKSYGMKILILKQYLDRYGYLYVRLSNRDLNNKVCVVYRRNVGYGVIETNN